jgi:hypothetical protein
MSDDRRLDAAIGTELFDLKVWSDYDECSQWTPGARWSYGSECYEIECWFAVPKNLTPEEVDELDLGDPKYQLKRYSSTWEGLGLVVEAMRGKGWTCELYCYPPRQPVKVKLYPSQPDPLPSYVAVCALDREPWTRADASAFTAPRAVSFAAYKALTGKEITLPVSTMLDKQGKEEGE